MPNPPSETPDTPAPGFSRTIKLSSPATREFWEISVLYEDNHFLALDKPARLLTSPDRFDPARPNLMALLHEGIARGAPWARERALSSLMNTHRLDPETSGVLLLAKTRSRRSSPRPTSSAPAEYPAPASRSFKAARAAPRSKVSAKLAPHQTLPGAMRVNSKHGKHAETRFLNWLKVSTVTPLVRCLPQTHRAHQIRVHLNFVGLPIAGEHRIRRRSDAAVAIEIRVPA